jgi:DNA helicase-2/ATP-dependent DNA helicase PcrA
LLHNLTIFQQHPDVLAEYQQRFRYILVDEYQDTNVAQYLWLRLLARSGHKNICCVGDDDQSIYGWRGAEVDNILRFEKDFPGAKVIRLEQNYRSTSHILGAASGLIAQKRPAGQDPVDRGRRGEKVRVRGVWDGEAEKPADRRGDRAQQQGGATPRHAAILVRASFQMRPSKSASSCSADPLHGHRRPALLRARRDPRRHAYLRLVQSPDDDLAFERIINTPKRGIGDTTVQKILQIARGAAFRPWRRRASGPDRRTDAAGAHAPVQLHPRHRPLARTSCATTAPPQLTETVLEESGYHRYAGRPQRGAEGGWRTSRNWSAR